MTSLLLLGTVDADLRAVDLEASGEVIRNRVTPIVGSLQPDHNCEAWITMMNTIIMGEASPPARRESISDKSVGFIAVKLKELYMGVQGSSYELATSECRSVPIVSSFLSQTLNEHLLCFVSPISAPKSAAIAVIGRDRGNRKTGDGEASDLRQTEALVTDFAMLDTDMTSCWKCLEQTVESFCYGNGLGYDNALRAGHGLQLQGPFASRVEERQVSQRSFAEQSSAQTSFEDDCVAGKGFVGQCAHRYAHSSC